MAKDAEVHLHVGDVYDLASEIGKEFEKVIDIHGVDIVRELMTKVIVTLEYLESCTVVIDNLQDELYDTKSRVQYLECEKVEKAEFKSKFDQELELIEENWRKEIDHLNALVVQLQEENKRLSSSLADTERRSQSQCKGCNSCGVSSDCVRSFQVQPPDSVNLLYQKNTAQGNSWIVSYLESGVPAALLCDEDLAIIQKLKEVAEEHRGQLLSKDKEILQKSNDLEKLQNETERLTKMNKELSHRNKHLQKQMHILIEEKSDLQAEIQSQQRELEVIEKQLRGALKENDDLATAKHEHQLDLKGKLIIDVDDPNRPRFTLDELRNILFERNDLKAKISDLEDELSMYKPKSNSQVQSPTGTSPISSEEEELPVQGPINREPEDKLFPEKKSHGIRRFFRFLRRFSVDSPVPLVPFSASHPSTGQNSSKGSFTSL